MEAVSQVIVVKESNNKVIYANYYFWMAFVLYSLSYTISTSGSVNFIYCQVLQIIAILMFVSSAIIVMQWRFDTTYLKIIYSLYIFWSLIVILRGFRFDYQFMKFILFDASFGIFLYFVPLVLLFPRDLLFYKRVFSAIVILSIAYLVFNVLFIKDMLYLGRNIKSQTIIEYFSMQLSIQSGFLLLTYMYHPKKRKYLALFVIVLTFLLAAIRARRGLMFMSIEILIFSFFMYYYAHKVKIVLFLFSLIFISSLYFLGTKIYTENRSGLFGYITERLEEKTRIGVEVYFYNDMKTVDWIFGKGLNGEYYCPVINPENGTFTVNRGVIETGYLQIILKGGVLSLGLLLLIAIPAIFRGLFHSKNFLSKAAGIWILLFLIDLYPATPTTFSMNYLLVWISIGICYSKTIRETPDSTIIEILSN